MKADVIKETADDIKSRRSLEAGVIDIASEMPSLEFKLTELEDLLSKAHEKQDNLESNLARNQTDIKYIMDYLQEFVAVKMHSQNLFQELEKASAALKREKDKYNKEIFIKDNELLRLKLNLEEELSRRVALEEALEKVKSVSSNNPEREEIQQCIHEMLSAHNIYNSGRQEMAIENNHLKFEIEDLKNQMASAKEERNILIQEDIKNKNRIQSLEQSNQEILTDFASICQKNLFERESQIFTIKSKMDSLVDLKNSLMSQDAGGEPHISLNVLVNINDIKTLKKEIVNLHKRLMDMDDTREELESIISSKNAKIKELESDLSSKYLEIEMMEGVLETMKEREKENSLLLEKIEFSSGFLSGEERHGDNDEKLKEIINWQDKKRSVVAELESKLKASEERYSLAEERRIRNEERIAILQVKLTQYEQGTR